MNFSADLLTLQETDLTLPIVCSKSKMTCYKKLFKRLYGIKIIPLINTLTTFRYR